MLTKTTPLISDKLLVICGPTSTGKTSLGIKIAGKFKGEIISADSRQVYKRMDIGTGKDIPENCKYLFPVAELKKDKIGCYNTGGVNIWGYDIVDPDRDFSVSHYIKYARKVIRNIICRGKLPILVGGTGLYIKGVVDGIESANIPKNEKLRSVLNKKNTDELYEILANVNPVKAASLNISDRKNPRRLVRAIEIAGTELPGKYKLSKKKADKYDTLFIGLAAPPPELERSIRLRVQKRVEKGVESEIKDLLSSGICWNMQSMNTMGYKEWVSYFNGKADKQKVLEDWVKNEKKYSKRQITWFKKDKRILWFDITARDWQKNIEKIVKKWHNEVHA